MERFITSSTLRDTCIEHDWYTEGSNDDYENLFSRLRNYDGSFAEMTIDKLEEITEDIMEHSDIDDNDWNRFEILQTLAKICNTAFYL
jgi:hypothetical protein